MNEDTQKVMEMIREEKRIDKGFEKWWSRHVPEIKNERDKHVERCAFHAGAFFEKNNGKSSKR